MSDDDRPIGAGHPPGRASRPIRVPVLSWFLRLAHFARQRRQATDSTGSARWLRLEVLGFTVMVMASMTLMHLLFRRPIPHYIPGMEAIFAGLMLIIGAVRLRQPFMLWERVLGGMSFIGMGLILSEYASLAPSWTFKLFCLLFLASTLLRGWIALTEREDDDGTAWLFASTATGLFCLSWLVLMRMTDRVINPDLVLAVDLMMLGLAIIGLGTSRREGSA